MSVTIVGSGIAGLSAALAVRQLRKSIKIRILDKVDVNVRESKGSRFHIGLWTSALKSLNKLGIYSDLLPQFEPILRSCYKDMHGRVLMVPTIGLSKPSENFDQPTLAFVSEAELLSSMKKHLIDVEIYHGQEVSGISNTSSEINSKIMVETTSNSRFESDYVIAADGAESSVRKIIHPDLSPLTYCGFKVFRGHSGRSSITGNRLSDLAFQSWGPGVRFATVPTKTGNQWFVAVSDKVIQSRSNSAAFSRSNHLLFDQGDDDIAEILTVILKDWHRPIQELISHRDGAIIWENAKAFDKCAEVGLNVASSRAGYKNVFFIGDASHTLDPILAVGAGVAICDSVKIAPLISLAEDRSSSGGNMTTNLIAYEKMKYERLSKLHMISKVAHLFGQVESEDINTLRNTVLNSTPAYLKGGIFDMFIRNVAGV